MSLLRAATDTWHGSAVKSGLLPRPSSKATPVTQPSWASPPSPLPRPLPSPPPSPPSGLANGPAHGPASAARGARVRSTGRGAIDASAMPDRISARRARFSVRSSSILWPLRNAEGQGKPMSNGAPRRSPMAGMCQRAVAVASMRKPAQARLGHAWHRRWDQGRFGGRGKVALAVRDQGRVGCPWVRLPTASSGSSSR